MFESLSTRLQDVFKTLRGESRLTPENIEVALREIRLALLEADVNFKVVKAFVDRVRDRAMDAVSNKDVLRGGLGPSQQVVKIVRDEMVALFGNAEGGLQPTTQAAARHPDARAAGRGQDDDVGQAGGVAEEAGQASPAGVDGREASGRDSAAERRRGESRRARARSGGRDGSGGARQGRGRRGDDARVRRGDRRHRRPAAHRRRVDGGAGRDQERDASRRICCSSPTR